MMLRKLQASSPIALAGTLRKLVAQLENDAAENSVRFRVDQAMEDDWDNYPILLDEWDESDDDPSAAETDSPVVWSVEEELRVLRELIALAEAIDSPCKTQALLHALKSALQSRHQAASGGALPNKAVIFTESRRTQEYLYERLQELLPAHELVIFNGTNEAPCTREIVRAWQSSKAATDSVTGNYSVDARAALIDHFRNHATVMIATEAAAEGLNLQFCSLVINYDLPWNPQRIEQRIGRCHRYGQTQDVVVINFLDATNAADRRVYQLLTERIRLFTDVFGASDEILGAIGADFGFEKRVAAIYATCRTPEEINEAFDTLDAALAARIAEARASAVNMLLSSFNPSVVAQFDVALNDQSRDIRRHLLQLASFVLGPHATIDAASGACELLSLPPGAPPVRLGTYTTHDGSEVSHELRWGHPLVEWIVNTGRALRPRTVEVRRSREVGAFITAGWTMCGVMTMGGASPIEEFIGVSINDSGTTLLWSACRRILESDGEVLAEVEPPQDVLARLRQLFDAEVERRRKDRLARNLEWHRREREKFAAWAADQQVELCKRIDEVTRKVEESGQRLSDPTASADDRVKLLRREKARRQELTDLHEQLVVTQRRVNTKQARVLDEMLKACKVTPDAEVLFVYRWS
ncbi:MAG: helicase-related protein [Pirellulales bacterium]